MERERIEIRDLHTRLDKAERNLRAFVIGWVLTVIFLGLVGTRVEQANSQLPSLRLRVVELVDTAGRPRLRAFAPTDGTANLTLMDVAGRPRILLQVAADGTPLIATYDASGHVLFTSLRGDLGGGGGK